MSIAGGALQLHDAECGGQRAFEALQKGHVDEILAEPGNAALGAFA